MFDNLNDPNVLLATDRRSSSVCCHASAHVVATFSRFSIAYLLSEIRSMCPSTLTITFEARGIFESPSYANWVSLYAFRDVARTRVPVFSNRLFGHAALAWIHFLEIFRDSWKTGRRKETIWRLGQPDNLTIEQTCFSALLISSRSSTLCYELVPYRKENAPDACYASAVTYGNAVHHFAGR